MKTIKLKAFVMAMAVLTTNVLTVGGISANADVQDTYTATLQGMVGSGRFWDYNAVTTTIDGDGQYSITLNFSEPTEATEGDVALIIDTDINPYDYIDEDIAETLSECREIAEATGINISIDSILVDGKEIEYKGPSAYAYVNEKNNLRLNIYNIWGYDIGVKDIDLNFAVEETITVNFTITGLDTMAIVSTEPYEEPIIDTTEEFHYDVNNDGSINILDLLILKKKLLGMPLN
jgi:hypothetical protein